MNVEKKQFLTNLFALLCATWFLLTGWLWTYFMNLAISFPIGLIGLFLWYKGGKQKDNKLNRAALIVLTAGLLLSGVSLFFYS